jgi:hypothetical protein
MSPQILAAALVVAVAVASPVTPDDALAHCGLPSARYTSHCFRDETHVSCCLLGPKARAYADASGNPIGALSERAAHDFNPSDPAGPLTPWCTCAGSRVCSYYARLFGDGTRVKFLYDRANRKLVPPEPSESAVADALGVGKHNTPGVRTGP